MRKFLFVLLSMSLILFSCKSQQKEKQQEEPPVVEEPVIEESEHKAKFVITCPADMKKVDVLMASQLDSIADAIKETDAKSVEFVGHSAKLNSAREEEQAAGKAIELIVGYLEDANALYGVDVKIENKGASEPLGSHSDISARMENRRVEVTLK